MAHRWPQGTATGQVRRPIQGTAIDAKQRAAQVVELTASGHAPLDRRINLAELLKDNSQTQLFGTSS